METCTKGPAYLSIINSIQNLHINRRNMAPVETAKTALLYSSLIRAYFRLRLLTATYPHMHLSKEGQSPRDNESWLPYFCHKLTPYGCNCTIKGWKERTKGPCDPFDRSSTIWKYYIFCFLTHMQTKECANTTHVQWQPRPIDLPCSLSLLDADDAWVDGFLVAWFTEKGPLNECIFTSCRTVSDREVNN